VIWASRQACGVFFPLAISTSILPQQRDDFAPASISSWDIPAPLQSEFSLTPAGTKIPGQVNDGRSADKFFLEF
jgi:hypothetical protein